MFSLAAAAKTRGTAAYKQRDFAGAKAEYAAAIAALSDDESERAELEPALLANLGACAIALEEWSGAVEVTTKCLELKPAHVKARYRRACAYEKLSEFEKAFTDMARVVHADPANARAKAAARRLRESIAKRPVAAPLVEAVKTLRSLVDGEASTFPPKRAALTLLSAAQGEQGEGARACARVGGIDALWRVIVAQPPLARDVVGPAMAALAALACRTDRAVESSRVVSNELADWPLLNAFTKTLVRSRERADDIHARSALRLLSCAAVPHPNIATAENPDRTMIYPKERAEIVSRSTLPPSPLEHEAVRAVFCVSSLVVYFFFFSLAHLVVIFSRSLPPSLPSSASSPPVSPSPSSTRSVRSSTPSRSAPAPRRGPSAPSPALQPPPRSSAARSRLQRASARSRASLSSSRIPATRWV